ncbi:MAG: NYN domain-containing protein [Opitutales bacterium]
MPPKKKPSSKPRASRGGRRPSRSSASRAHAPSTSTPEAARGSKSERIALLIDADNVSHGFLPTLRDFVGETPVASARAYGDFQNHLHSWRKAAEEWPALELVEQRNYTAGKNATDMRLTIDAVKLLAGKEPPTTLVFVTNDSDFTPVVEDAKKDGVRIVVMGERPHRALRSAAHHYVNLTELRDRLEHKAAAESDPREVLRLLLVALRSVPKLGAEAEQALAEAERRLPLLRFATGKAPAASRNAAGPSNSPARGRRGRRGGRADATAETTPAQGTRGGATGGIDPNALRRKEELLARADLIQSLVDAARSLPSQDGWVKGEFILRRVRELVPDFDRMAPRYAKFYRMLEDTGRFDVELRASTVFARPHEA